MAHIWRRIDRHVAGRIKAAYNEEMGVYVGKNTKVSAIDKRAEAAEVALNAMQTVMRMPELVQRPFAATGSVLDLADARGRVELQRLPEYKVPSMQGPVPGWGDAVKLLGVDDDDCASEDDYRVAGAKEREVQKIVARAERRKAKKPAPKPRTAAGGSGSGARVATGAWRPAEDVGDCFSTSSSAA